MLADNIKKITTTPAEFPAIRKELGLTRVQLAEILGASKTFIYQVETERREPNVTLQRLIKLVYKELTGKVWK